MRGVVFGRRIGIAVGLFIGGFDVGFGCRTRQKPVDHFGGQKRALLILQNDADIGGLGSIKGLRQDGLLHQLVQNSRKQHLVGQLFVLLWQVGARNRHLAKGDVFAIDRGNDGCGAQVFGAAWCGPCQCHREGRGRDCGQKAAGGKTEGSVHRLVLQERRQGRAALTRV